MAPKEWHLLCRAWTLSAFRVRLSLVTVTNCSTTSTCFLVDPAIKMSLIQWMTNSLVVTWACWRSGPAERWHIARQSRCAHGNRLKVHCKSLHVNANWPSPSPCTWSEKQALTKSITDTPVSSVGCHCVRMMMTSSIAGTVLPVTAPCQPLCPVGLIHWPSQAVHCDVLASDNVSPSALFFCLSELLSSFWRLHIYCKSVCCFSCTCKICQWLAEVALNLQVNLGRIKWFYTVFQHMNTVYSSFTKLFFKFYLHCFIGFSIEVLDIFS